MDDRTRLDEDLGEVADVIRADLGKRPVYVIGEGFHIRELEDDFVLEPVLPRGDGSIYRVVGTKGGGS